MSEGLGIPTVHIGIFVGPIEQWHDDHNNGSSEMVGRTALALSFLPGSIDVNYRGITLFLPW